MRLMKRGGWATDEHLLRQHSKNSVIRTSVLRKMGVGAKTIVDRTAGGPWQRILPGLVLLHNGPPTWTQRVTAALMYGAGDAMLTGRAGLALHGYSTSAHHSQTMLLIPHASHRKDTSFVAVERTWRLHVAPRHRAMAWSSCRTLRGPSARNQRSSLRTCSGHISWRCSDLARTFERSIRGR